MRYHLDDLGWTQFEWLVQSLLKAHLGLSVESWGGRGDHGRDAYSDGPLFFPLPAVSEVGPFVFQAKFVENANAAGADPLPALMGALQKEALRIAKRISQGIWVSPRHYALCTNVVLSPDARRTAEAALQKTMPTAVITTLTGLDVCDLLDQHPALRRSFPQLLSLRDLDSLLTEAVAKEVLERSDAARQAANDLVHVFVPTEAYSRTWRTLRKHHFAVLEGPPEMGKSAIAWMIALSLLSEGWHALVCDNPDDFFMAYDGLARQVFVADDAFGRTEYDPTRGRRWEVNLHRVISQLNSTHWLIWTSRKHILERAQKAMDLQGDAARFPRPAEVLVDTSKLTKREKALILYRQGRSRQLLEAAKIIVKSNVRDIVLHEHFTPERIRQFVVDKLPALASSTTDEAAIRSQIKDAIRNPTDRMRKTFAALPIAHKWVLFALLEVGESLLPKEDTISRLYVACCPPEQLRPFEDVRDELLESFPRWTPKTGH